MNQWVAFFPRFIWSVRWRVIINLMLLIALGYSMVDLLLRLTTVPVTQTQPTRQAMIHHQTQTRLPTLEIAPLLEARLFGDPELSAVAVKPPPTTVLPETKLNLKLYGVYCNSEPANSYAIIAEAAGKSVAYRLGQTLPSGVTVHEIQPKQVILSKNGQYETLRLVNSQSNPNKSTVNKPMSNINNSPTAQSPPTTTTPLKPSQLLGNFQRQLLTNPQNLLRAVRIDPVNEGGNLVGYRVSPGQDASLMSQFNLQTGDILTAVNGVTLDSPLKGLGIVQQLATTDHLHLQVLRNGQPVSLSFAVDK